MLMYLEDFVTDDCNNQKITVIVLRFSLISVVIKHIKIIKIFS